MKLRTGVAYGAEGGVTSQDEKYEARNLVATC